MGFNSAFEGLMLSD